MFFEKEMLSCNILEVIKLNQKNINTFNIGRNFGALSFRTHSNTVLKTDKSEYYVGDNCITYVPARLDYSRVSVEDELTVIHFDTTDYRAEDIEFFIPKEPEIFSKLFSEIEDLWRKKETGYKYKCTAVFYEILAKCYSQNFKAEVKNEKIKNAVDYMLKNYKNKNLSIGEIAERDFISEVYFRKIFKSEYGISPKKYIINLRIQNAEGLIATGYYSLQEIADMCGYSDYKHFTVEFKKIVGVSPSKYLYNYNNGQ